MTAGSGNAVPALAVSVCIATYRRPERLQSLLADLAAQTLAPCEVVVVDNDAAGSARAVTEACRAARPLLPIRYAIQPVKNISLTRNLTVELASGEWLAFADDDERAPEQWLATLAQALVRYGADGVLGPVEPVLPDDAPGWIRRGRFYDFPHLPSGSVIPPNRLRFGNVLLRAAPVRALGTAFDPAYGLTGGEDGDMLARLALKGARIVWCDEAMVYEPVEKARLNLKWLLRRALRGGQDFARHALAGRYGQRRAGGLRLIARALAQLVLAAVLAALCLPFGRHYAVHWLTKASANAGKLSIFLGWHYREYA